MKSVVVLAFIASVLLFSVISATPRIPVTDHQGQNSTPTPTGGSPMGDDNDDGDDMDASPSPTEDDPICFPGDATVELEDGQTIPMENVNVGDRVKVGKDEYSEVFMFTHRLSDVHAKFVKISVSGGKTIRATPGHYLYANGRLTAAKAIKIGDTVEVDGSCNGVEKTEIVNGKGLYNPQTLHGDIIVDGVRSSTYTTTVEPRVAHWLLAPLRGMYKISGYSTAAFDTGNFGLAKIAPKGQAVY